MPVDEWVFQRSREEYVSKTGVIGYRGTNSAGKLWFNHMSAAKIKKQMDETTWNEYFKFTVIRNPYDKLVSKFFFSERPSGTEEQLIANFRDWLQNGGMFVDRQIYTIDGSICLDYFIRYEYLENGIGQVCKHLNIPFEPEKLPQLKANIRDNNISLRAFYDDELKKVVREEYAFELAYFKYTFPK